MVEEFLNEDTIGVISIPFPQPGSGQCSLQCQLLKELHVEVGHHRRDWRAHRCNFLVEVSFIAEVGGPQADLQQLWDLFQGEKDPVPQCLILPNLSWMTETASQEHW